MGLHKGKGEDRIPDGFKSSLPDHSNQSFTDFLSALENVAQEINFGECLCAFWMTG